MPAPERTVRPALAVPQDENPDRLAWRLAVGRARHAWQPVAVRLLDVRPREVARLLLLVVAAAVTALLVRITWPALLPFVFGAALAYVLLPLVDLLDVALPRPLAALLALVAAVLLLSAAVGLIVPLLAGQLLHLYLLVPNGDDVRSIATAAADAFRTLPEPVQEVIREAVRQAVLKARENVDVALRGLAILALTGAASVGGVLGFLLGFVLVPAWLVALLSTHRTGLRTVNRLLPAGLRNDFWAVLRIADRAFGAFLRGLVITGLAAGLLTYGALEALARLGAPVPDERVVVALIAGLVQFIPTFGVLLALPVALLVGLTVSPQAGLTSVVVLLVVQQVVNTLVLPRIERRVADLPPTVLVLVIVALSQLGLIWVLLATPVAAVAYDLFRYVYGRFAEPPRPAGLLPGESVRGAARRTTWDESGVG
jgi:predicted PurR-regulated permease PerM